MKIPKEKLKFRQIIKHWFTYHPWLKIIALIIAVLVWLSVRTEIYKSYY